MQNDYVRVFFFANGVPGGMLRDELRHDRRVLAVLPCVRLNAACVVTTVDVDLNTFEEQHGGIVTESEAQMRLVLGGSR